MFGLVFSEKLTGKSIEIQSMPQPGTFDLLAFASASPLGPLRQAFLTRLYQFETDCLSGSINRSVVTPF
jgi:hypothetical protein